MNVLALITDAFGGHGGIAQYNCDMLTALCMYDRMSHVLAIPRLSPNSTGPLPRKLRFDTSAIEGQVSYLRSVCSGVAQKRRWDAIFCGHINLSPLAVWLGRLLRVPVALQVHGIDGWNPPARRLSAQYASKVDAVLSVSNFTLDGFLSWSGFPSTRCRVIPNTYHPEMFGPGDKPQRLVERYGVKGDRVLLTLGRLVSRERSKGFDEVLQVLPDLLKSVENLTYIVAGDGPDRSRLEDKARHLGILDRVKFTGMVPEEEKADLYRIADAYVMPSRGEGFGIVHLEAMACGVPAVASKLDGSREALRGGLLGELVDPRDLCDVKRGILAALQKPRRVEPGLEYFAFDNYLSRVHHFLDELTEPGSKLRSSSGRST